MVKIFLSFLLHWLFHILALKAFACGTTAFAGTIAFTVLFKTVAFWTFTFCSILASSNQKQLLLVSTTYTFTVICTRQSLFKTFTIIFLTASFGAKTSSHRTLRVCTCLGRSIGCFKLGRIQILQILFRNGGRFVVVADGALFIKPRLGDKLFQQVLIFIILIESIQHNHDLFFLLHRFNSLLLHRHDITKQIQTKYQKISHFCLTPLKPLQINGKQEDPLIFKGYTNKIQRFTIDIVDSSLSIIETVQLSKCFIKTKTTNTLMGVRYDIFIKKRIKIII